MLFARLSDESPTIFPTAGKQVLFTRQPGKLPVISLIHLAAVYDKPYSPECRVNSLGLFEAITNTRITCFL